MIKIKIRSNYHYRKDNDRITKHLHNWLYSFKENGKAKDFDIEGTTWSLAYSDLPSTKVNNSIRKYIDFNRLYM